MPKFHYCNITHTYLNFVTAYQLLNVMNFQLTELLVICDVFEVFVRVQFRGLTQGIAAMIFSKYSNTKTVRRIELFLQKLTASLFDT